MTPYDYFIFGGFFACIAGMIGLILFFRHMRLHPPKRHQSSSYRHADSDAWSILDEIDRDDW